MRRNAQILLALAAGLVLATCISVNASAQEMAVYLMPDVRAKLQASWDSTRANQSERAYCLDARLRETARGDTAWLVMAATRAVSSTDGPYHIAFGCGRVNPALHVHTPTSCDSVGFGVVDYSTCHLGGEDAYQCFPSPQDQYSLDRSGKPFAVVQCDEDSFVIFYPTVGAAPQPAAEPAKTAAPKKKHKP